MNPWRQNTGLRESRKSWISGSNNAPESTGRGSAVLRNGVLMERNGRGCDDANPNPGMKKATWQGRTSITP